MVIHPTFKTRLAAIAAVAVFAAPMPAAAATTNVTVKATLLKTLTLAAKQDFDFGQILLPSSGSAVTMSISTTGVVTCPAPLICSGTPKPAIFNAQGSNQQVVRVTAAPVNLTNAAGNVLVFTPIVPSNFTLTNSGFPGSDFGVGGSITVSPTTADGVYSGTLQVTADYQ